MGCSVEFTDDMGLVESIIKLPEIWDRIAEDGIDKEEFKPTDGELNAWFICKSRNEVIGVMLINFSNSTTLMIHPYIIKRKRFLGREIMKEFYKLFLKSDKSLNKVLISIPENQKKVHNFAKKVGFVDEGINRKSCVKNGELLDQINMGITREEIQRFLLWAA